MATPHIPALIVGAGPIGLACAISARRRGIDALVIDAGAIAESIVRYPVGMTFFTTPERLEIGGHPLVCAGQKATREEALKYYRGVVRAEGLRVRTGVRLVTGGRADGQTGGPIRALLSTRHGEERVGCDRLILATGYFDHPNRLGIPGEELPHVSHYADEPHVVWGQDVVIIGGKNSAVEAALLYFRAGARVTLVYRRPELRPTVKYWLRPDLDNRIRAGEIRALFGAEAEAITVSGVRVRRADGKVEEVPADRVYALTGYHPDFALFDRLGIISDPVTGKPTLDPGTLETNVLGVHLAGSAGAGRAIGEVFIENGRLDGEKIFGTPEDRRRAADPGGSPPRPEGE
ncbi:MAG TPA: YpdA family putative bacillithiol disulfide reductase [Gemmatimonadales bacterium]